MIKLTDTQLTVVVRDYMYLDNNNILPSDCKSRYLQLLLEVLIRKLEL